MDNLTPVQRRKNMSRIKSTGSSIEVLLRKALWREGIRYRKNVKKLPGKPDIVITKYKVAVFCDGELWHGKDWITKEKTINTNRDYWIPKIERNIMRDNKNEKKLERMGWVVLRFWGKDIEKNLIDCVNEIKETIYSIKFDLREEYCFNRDDLQAADDEPEYTQRSPSSN